MKFNSWLVRKRRRGGGVERLDEVRMEENDARKARIKERRARIKEQDAKREREAARWRKREKKPRK